LLICFFKYKIVIIEFINVNFANFVVDFINLFVFLFLITLVEIKRKSTKIDIILFHYTRRDEREDLIDNNVHDLFRLLKSNKRNRRDVNE